ncbi:MAG: CHASE2 domain-containing protein, partial [FCB group bacterium]
MKLYKKLLNLDGLISTTLVFIALLFFSFIFTKFSFLLPFYNALSDFEITDINYQVMRVPGEVLADTNIVMINITDLSNEDLANLISSINENKPKVVGIDRILKPSGNDSSDLKLANALSQTKNLVLANKFIYNPRTQKYDSLIYSDKLFSKFAIQGFSNLLLNDRENVETIRHFFPKVKVGDSIYLPFSVQIAKIFKPECAAYLFNRNNEEEIINFRGKFDKFYFVSEPETIINNEIDKNLFKDKILLLSASDPLKEKFIFYDKYFTPLNENASGKTFPDMYGIEIHTNIIS